MHKKRKTLLDFYLPYTICTPLSCSKHVAKTTARLQELLSHLRSVFHSNVWCTVALLFSFHHFLPSRLWAQRRSRTCSLQTFNVIPGFTNKLHKASVLLLQFIDTAATMTSASECVNVSNKVQLTCDRLLNHFRCFTSLQLQKGDFFFLAWMDGGLDGWMAGWMTRGKILIAGVLWLLGALERLKSVMFCVADGRT